MGQLWTVVWASGQDQGGDHGHCPGRADGGLDPGAGGRTRSSDSTLKVEGAEPADTPGEPKN